MADNRYPLPFIGFGRSLVQCCCCSCSPTPPCLFGGVLPYFEITGHPATVSSLGFKCPDCFIWNCSYNLYPSKMKGTAVKGIYTYDLRSYWRGV